MATVTLVANTNYTLLLTLANGDTIDCAGFRLTINAQPTHTNISVVSPGTAGRMTVSGAYDMSTWSITAGTVALIDGALPLGAVLGSSTGGSDSNAFGVTTNSGTISTSTGGSGTNAHGVSSNASTGIVTNATGSPVAAAHGVNTNAGMVITARGGSVSNSYGVSANNGAISNAIGGSTNNAYGVNVNNCSVGYAEGGTAVGAFGVNSNLGSVLRATDISEFAINFWRGNEKLIIGPAFHSRITNTVGTTSIVYSLGPLSSLATIEVGITVIQLSTSSGQLINGGLIRCI